MKLSNINIILLKSLFLFIFLILPFLICAQQDTLPKITKEQKEVSVARKKRSPTAASLMSMVIPGLGQTYNKKYWKVPIIYGAIGGLAYAANKNDIGYQKYKKAYINRTDEDEDTVDDYVGILTDANLESEMDKWRKARDFDFIIIGLVYFLNIVDASVDAHLFNFDVSDDLSLNINPNYMVYPNRKPSVGLTLTFNLKHSHNQ